MTEPNGKNTLMILVAAIGFGIVAAVLSIFYLKAREAAILASLDSGQQQNISVVVAADTIPEGTRITEDLLAVLEMPADYVPDTALNVNNYENYLGRFVTHDISSGKPILSVDLNSQFPADFSDLIEKGRRAMTIQVDDLSSISGMIRPGNRIDLYAIIQTKITGYTTDVAGFGGLPPALTQAALAAVNSTDAAGEIDIDAGQLQQALGASEGPKDMIIPVIQDVRVLATDKEAYEAYLDQYQLPQRRYEESFNALTLDVDPEQAGLLSLAADKGDLVALLRNRDDRSLAEFDGLTPLDILKRARKMQELGMKRKAAEEAGISIDADGNYIDENGNVIPPEDLIFNADGSVTTKQAMMEAAGYTKNENGDYVDANGNIIKSEDVKVLANGTVMTKDGKVLSGDKVTVNEDGFIIAEDGTVMNANGEIIAGARVNAKGQVIGADGKVITDSSASGTSSLENQVNQLLSDYEAIQLIIGGQSKDGKAKQVNLPVESVNAQSNPATATE